MNRLAIRARTSTVILVGFVMLLGLSGCKRRVRFIRHRVPIYVQQEDRREILPPLRSVRPGVSPRMRKLHR